MNTGSDGNTVNLGEAKAALGFMWGLPDGIARRPDPRFVTFKPYLAKRNTDYTVGLIEAIEFEYVNEIEHS